MCVCVCLSVCRHRRDCEEMASLTQFFIKIHVLLVWSTLSVVVRSCGGLNVKQLLRLKRLDCGATSGGQENQFCLFAAVYFCFFSKLQHYNYYLQLLFTCNFSDFILQNVCINKDSKYI